MKENARRISKVWKEGERRRLQGESALPGVSASWLELRVWSGRRSVGYSPLRTLEDSAKPAQ